MSLEGWDIHCNAGNTRLSKLIMGLLALALLLALRPYAGIRHDAVFYLGQGLFALYPEEFGKDLFFAYGSQASYTLTPQLLGGLMEYFPASQLFAWLTLAGRFAFLLCSYLLLRKLFNGRVRYLALLTLLVLPAAYGSKFIFSYGEPFFTGRSLAEPLCLLSLVVFFSRRYFLAASLWLLAAVVHPLQALAVALVLWCWLCVIDRRWVWLAFLAVIVAFFAYLVRGPSFFLFQQYDSQWLAWVSGPNRNVFLKNWPVDSWVSLGLDFLLILLARRFVQGGGREFYTALLAALIVGFVASLVLADWLSLVLPTGLQLWRVQWIAHWGAMAAIPMVMWQVLQQVYGRERSLFLFATIIWAVPVGAMAPNPLLSLVPLALFFFWPSIAPKIRERFRIATVAGFVIALIIGAFKYCLVVYLAFLKQGGSLNNYRLDSIVLAYPLIACLVLALIYFGMRRFGQPARCSVFVAVAAFSVYSMISWDSRSTWNTYIENSAGENPFGTPIEQGAQIYWADMLLAPWSVLHRPSYFNEGQQAGLLFNRETARQASIRSSVTQILSFQSEICAVVNSAADRDDNCAPDIQTVRDMCEAAEGELNYIVLPNRLSEPPMGQWTIPKGYSGESPVTYYLYGCAGLSRHAVANGG